MSPPPDALPLWRPLLQSFAAGLATTVGGLVVYALPKGSTVPPRLVSASLAFAAGVMVAVSVLDLWLPVAATAPVAATLYALAGAGLCHVLSQLPLPGFDAALARLAASQQTQAHARGASAGSGALMAGADVESAASSELQPAPPADDGSPAKSRAPASSSQPADGLPSRDPRALRLGAVMCAVLSLHNLPEGMVVMVAGSKSAELGLVVAVAIFAHNIAEGFSVAIPVMAGTGDRRLALAMTAASGLSEPLGALLGYVLLRAFRLGDAIPLETLLNASLCAVGGVMAVISATELLPEALRAARGDTRFVAQAAAAGAGVITLSLLLQ